MNIVIDGTDIIKLAKEIKIEKILGGFCISAIDERHAFPIYVMRIYKGEYSWATDYMYSKRFSKATAEKHLKILRKQRGEHA